MAVDTRQKRFNMMYSSSPITFLPLFEADSSVDADDRAHLLHLYGGNALDNPSTGAAGPFHHHRQVNLRVS